MVHHPLPEPADVKGPARRGSIVPDSQRGVERRDDPQREVAALGVSWVSPTACRVGDGGDAVTHRSLSVRTVPRWPRRLETRYARSGDVHHRLPAVGLSGLLNLVFLPGWISHVELNWEEPALARFLDRLGSFATVAFFDKRGTGLSTRSPLAELPTIEQRMDDVRAVMDDAGMEQAALIGDLRRRRSGCAVRGHLSRTDLGARALRLLGEHDADRGLSVGTAHLGQGADVGPHRGAAGREATPSRCWRRASPATKRS